MKTILTTTLVALLATPLLYADADMGQRLYLKKLKSKCKMTGAQMAAKYTQFEWEEDQEENTLLIKECPKAKKFIKSDSFQEKYKSHIYDFLEKYGSDSGEVPSC